MSEKILDHDRKEFAGDLSAEGALSAMPPAFSPTAGPSDPNLGRAAQLKGDASTDKTARKTRKTPVRLKSISVPGIPKKIVSKITESEGIRLDVYEDSKSLPTVGVGHLLSNAEKKKWPVGTLLTLEEITAFAKADIGTAWTAAEKQAGKIKVSSEDFKIALFEVNFQLGTEWYTIHKKTWGYLMAGEWEKAAVEAKASKWAIQTPARVANFQAALRKLKTSGNDSGEGFNFWATVKDGIKNEQQPKKEAPAKEGMWSLALKAIETAKRAKQESNTVPELKTGREAVIFVQAQLKTVSLYDGKIDGVEFRRDGKESNTTKGLKAYQKKEGVPVTGKIDKVTWAKMHGGNHKTTSLFDGKMSMLATLMKAETTTIVIFDKLRELRKEAMGLESAHGWKPSGKFVDDDFFVSQSPGATGKTRATFPGWTNCRHAATDIVMRYMKAKNPALQKELGVVKNKDYSRDGGFLRVLEEDKSRRKDAKEADNWKKDEWLNVSDQANDALSYIDEKLASKVPVVVGIDHTFNRNLGKDRSSKKGNGYNEGTTDHFVTLTGSDIDKNGRKFYSYFEVGTKHISGGTSENNKLIEVGKGKYKATNAGAGGDQVYHLSMVLVFKADRGKYTNEITENNQVVKNVRNGKEI